MNLSKVTLTKKNESKVLLAKEISLAKKGEKEFLINLNWTAKQESQKPEPQGFFAKLAAWFEDDGPIDLDLGCFFKLRSGDWDGWDRWVLDGLQFSGIPEYQGHLDRAPWIYHTGDDRTGADEAGESIKVNLNECHNIERINVYAFIYEGATDWSKTDAVVRIQVPGQADIEVPMGNEDSQHRFCVIATLDFSPEGDITVTRNMTWHDGHAEMDQAYGWGMSWKAGSK